MARHADVEWRFPKGVQCSWESRLLMDIWEEVWALRQLFERPGFFYVPQRLRAIERNTHRKKHTITARTRKG